MQSQGSQQEPPALQPGMIETAKQERSLILRQRLSGMQLKSYSSSPVVKVAATREGKAISILIVGNTADIAPRPVTIPPQKSARFPCIRLAHFAL